MSSRNGGGGSSSSWVGSIGGGGGGGGNPFGEEESTNRSIRLPLPTYSNNSNNIMNIANATATSTPSTISSGDGVVGVGVKQRHDGVTTTPTPTKHHHHQQQQHKRISSRAQTSKTTLLKELVFNPTASSSSPSSGSAATGGAAAGGSNGTPTTPPTTTATATATSRRLSSSSSSKTSLSSLPSLRSIRESTLTGAASSASSSTTQEQQTEQTLLTTTGGRNVGQSSFSSSLSSSSTTSSSTHPDGDDDESYDLNDVCEYNDGNNSNSNSNINIKKVQGGVDGGDRRHHKHSHTTTTTTHDSHHHGHNDNNHDSVYSIDTADPQVIAIGVEVVERQQQRQQRQRQDTASAAQTTQPWNLTNKTNKMTTVSHAHQQHQQDKRSNTKKVITNFTNNVTTNNNNNNTDMEVEEKKMDEQTIVVVDDDDGYQPKQQQHGKNTPMIMKKKMTKEEEEEEKNKSVPYTYTYTTTTTASNLKPPSHPKTDDDDDEDDGSTKASTSMISGRTLTSDLQQQGLKSSGASGGNDVSNTTKVRGELSTTDRQEKLKTARGSLAMIMTKREAYRPHSRGTPPPPLTPQTAAAVAKSSLNVIGGTRSSSSSSSPSTVHYHPHHHHQKKSTIISSLKDPPMVRPERSKSPVNSWGFEFGATSEATAAATTTPPQAPPPAASASSSRHHYQLKRMQSISSLTASPPEKPVRRPSLIQGRNDDDDDDDEEGYDGTGEMVSAGWMMKKKPPTTTTGSNGTSKMVEDDHDHDRDRDRDAVDEGEDDDDAADDCNDSSNSDGIDLDEKTRERIIAQSAANAMMQKRRQSSMSMSRTASSRSNGSGGNGSIYSTTSSAATANTSNLGFATSSTAAAATTATAAAAAAASDGKSTIDEKQAARDSRRAFARREIPPSSASAGVSGTDKRNLNISSFEAATVTTRSRMTRNSISSTEGIASSSSHHGHASASNHSRPLDEKAAYRSRPITRLSGASTSSSSSFQPGAVPRVCGSQSTTKPRRISSIMSADISVYIEDDASVEEEEEEGGGGGGSGGDTAPLRPVTTSDIASGQMEVVNETEDLEAQAGVPVLLPGAFAVSGLNDDRENPSGYDSGADDDGNEDNTAVECAPASPENRTSLDPSVVAVATDSPLEAELYEVDEGVAALEILTVEQLAEQKKEAEEEQRRKDCKKVMILGTIVTLVIAAVSATVGVLVPRKTKSDDGDAGGTSGGGVIVSGWEASGSLTVPTEMIKDNIQFGSSVAISSEGTRLAIGLPGLVDPDSDQEATTGSVFVYDWINGTGWETISAITSEGFGGVIGESVGISADGTRLVLGVPSSSQDGVGYVEVYEESSVPGEWELVNDIIIGDESENVSFSANFGGSVSFSSDGTVFAVADTNANNEDNSVKGAGLVQVFRDNNETWTPLGGVIYGLQENGRFGRSLVLSGDGFVLAASTLGNNAPGSISTFRFDDTSESWEPMGLPVVGDSALESFGASITLSHDGLILATGAPDFSRNGEEPKVGIVRTYRFDEDQQQWLPTGRPIEGENSFDNFGSSVALSSEGDVLVVGAPDNDYFCENCGHIRVYAQNLTESSPGEDGAWGVDFDLWNPVGSPLGTNETDGGKYGSAVAISSNGTRVVGSAPFTTFNGFVSSVGQVHVFDLDGEA